MRGRCRFCGCTELNACPGGCSWLDATESVCSACEFIAIAWAQLPRAQRKPNMACAFFRGFISATGDPRVRRFVVVTDADDRANPYGPTGNSSRYWHRGYAAGEQVAAMAASMS